MATKLCCILRLFFLLALLPGCVSHLETQPVVRTDSDKLVGHWRYTLDAKNYSDLTFSSDGTFAGRVERDGIGVWSFSGKWRLEKHTLGYDYTASSQARFPVGTKDTDELIDVDATHFVVKTTSGTLRTYVRLD